MTHDPTSQRTSRAEYASALLYFGPICLPYAAGSAALYYYSIGPMPALWLILAVASIVVWLVFSIEVAEF